VGESCDVQVMKVEVEVGSAGEGGEEEGSARARSITMVSYNQYSPSVPPY